MKNAYKELNHTNMQIKDYSTYLENIGCYVNDVITRQRYDNIKYQLTMHVEFYETTLNNKKEITKMFNSGTL